VCDDATKRPCDHRGGTQHTQCSHAQPRIMCSHAHPCVMHRYNHVVCTTICIVHSVMHHAQPCVSRPHWTLARISCDHITGEGRRCHHHHHHHRKPPAVQAPRLGPSPSHTPLPSSRYPAGLRRRRPQRPQRPVRATCTAVRRISAGNSVT
jgi:hypothetical protein